jgi:hypothetical protein
LTDVGVWGSDVRVGSCDRNDADLTRRWVKSRPSPDDPISRSRVMAVRGCLQKMRLVHEAMKAYAPICSRVQIPQTENQVAKIVFDLRPAICSGRSTVLVAIQTKRMNVSRAAMDAVVMGTLRTRQRKVEDCVTDPFLRTGMQCEITSRRLQIAKMLVAKAMKASSWKAGVDVSREKAKMPFKVVAVTSRTRLSPASVQATRCS